MNREMNNVLLNIPIGCPSIEAAVDKSMAAIEGKASPMVFAFAMAHSLNVAQTDKDFAQALHAADIVVADGVGVSVLGRLAGVDVGVRIPGEVYFLSLMNALEKRGKGRIFFFGSSENVLELIGERLKSEFPSLELCGVLSPPYRPWSDLENLEMIEQINAVSPDVLWVGMGAPKQEKWVHKSHDMLDVPVIGSIGAVFDYFAGTIPAPPSWVRRMGLETPYRLIKEPRRLWRRVFLSNAMFVLRVFRQHILRIGA